MSTIARPYIAYGPGDELPVVKDQLRGAIRSEREKRSAKERERAAVDLAQLVGDLETVRGAHTIACYVSRPAEPGTYPLLDRLAGRKARVMLPMLGTGLTRQWAWLTTTAELEVRAPGRPAEPAGPGMDQDALAQADVVIVPALAVDTAGRRLGHGGGWYDRVLEHVRPGVTVLGLVWPEELYDAATHPLPTEPHDRPVHAVATTAGWRQLGQPTAG